ncbi:hypothetical protein GCM10028821_39720 [Hymenobacter jeollabukensis]
MALASQAQPVPRNARLDSLEARLPQLSRPDTNRVRHLNELVWENRDSNPRRALRLAAEAEALGQRLRYRRGLAKTYILRGIIYATTGRFAEAIADFDRCRRERAALGDWQGVAGAINNIGEVQASQGHYQQAVATYVRALRLEEKYGTPERIAADLANLGVVYYQLGRYAQALRYHRRYLHLPGRTPDAHNDAQAHYLLGQDFARLGPPDSARHHYQQAIAISHAHTDLHTEAQAQLGLGELLVARRDYAAAATALGTALLLATQVDDAATRAGALSAQGRLLLAQRQPAAAQAAFEQAYALGRRIQAREVVRGALQGLSTAHARQGRYAQALRYSEQTAALKDSLLNEASTRQITEMQVRYDTERQAARNRLQAAQLRAQQQLIRRRNTQLIGGLVVAALLAGLAYLLHTRRRLQQRVAFEQERQQLERQRAAAVLEAEENERRRIGSDLHDGIGQLLTAAKLNLHALQQQLGPGRPGHENLLDNALAVVDESFREVRGISHNLMPNALIKRGLAAAVRDFLDKLPSDNGLRVEVQAYGIDATQLPPHAESVLFRVIQELVQNIIKHAQATEVTIQLVQSAAELTVTVEDNGRGFDAQGLEADVGIGLRNVATRMTYLGGRAELDTAPGRGTTVTLEVPLTAPPAPAA